MPLAPSEKIQMVMQIFTLLKTLTDEAALAGIILTDSSYEEFKLNLGFAAIPFGPAPDVTLDPRMEHAFVVDGLLIMRGTQIED